MSPSELPVLADTVHTPLPAPTFAESMGPQVHQDARVLSDIHADVTELRRLLQRIEQQSSSRAA